MANTFDVQVTGLAELEARLKLLPNKVAGRIGRNALRAGLRVIRKEAVTRAPIGRTGNLRKGIKVRTRDRGLGEIKGAVVSTAPHTHLVEQGTKPHFIRPANRKALRFGGIFAEAVYHPGSRAQPFMEPAFRAADEALPAVRKSLIRGIERNA